MPPLNYVDPPGRDWDLRPLVIIVPDSRAAAVVRLCMQKAQKWNFGLFSGMLGNFAGVEVAVAITDAGEDPTYVALRQLCFLFRPKVALYFGNATGAVEWLRPGDLTWVSEARRCFHPIAISDNMFHDDEAVFNSVDLQKRVLSAPAHVPDAVVVAKLQEKVSAERFPLALQQSFPGVRTGSSDRNVAAYRGLEFASHRYGVEAVDHGTYGFFAALETEQIGGAALLQVTAGCSVEYVAEFRHHAKRFNRLACEVLEAAAAALLSRG